MRYFDLTDLTMKELIKKESQLQKRYSGLTDIKELDSFINDREFITALECNIEVTRRRIFEVRARIRVLELELKKGYRLRK